jgi:hypothetical protein
MTRRNRPRTDQPLLPLRDTVRTTQSDLDREVQEWAKETRREPMDGQQRAADRGGREEAMSDASIPDCPNCLEPEYACRCVSLHHGFGDFDAPAKAVIAWRSLTNPRVRFWGKEPLPYHLAVERCLEMNRLYAGKVEHFLLTDERTTMSEDLKRLRPLLMTDHDRDLIERALRLRHALDGNHAASTQASDGDALAGIVADWMEATTAKLRAAKGGPA